MATGAGVGDQCGVASVASVQEIRSFKQPRRTADTERGQRIRHRIELLEKLIDAYQTNRLYERTGDTMPNRGSDTNSRRTS